MSMFRLLLIPVYLWLYCVREDYAASIAVIALSALTDIFDGRVARRFNMVSDFGKVLDPIADKLTQAALLLSLCTRYGQLLPLFILFALKELIMLVMGGVVLRKTDTINGAKWYGKLGTVVLETSLALLILIPRMPILAVNIIIAICGAVMLFVLVMYLLFYLHLLHAQADGRSVPHHFHWLRAIVLASWVLVIVVAVALREHITVDSVLGYTPHSAGLAVAFLMLLYALKSVSVVIYIGILYVVDALIFSVPAAMAVSMAGTIVSVTVPYLLGRRLGAAGAERLMNKHERLRMLQRMQRKSDFLFSLLSRLLLFLPSDLVSFYMGAVRLHFGKYLLGCIVGFAPLVVLFTLMGDGVTDLHAPQFWITAAVAAAMIAASLLVFGVLVKKQRETPEET